MNESAENHVANGASETSTVETNCVKPSPLNENIHIKGPSFTPPDLSFPDVYIPGLYSYRIIIFKTSSSLRSRQHLVSTLRTGLRNLVEICPILTGTVQPLENPQQQGLQRGWKTIIPGNGLECLVRDLSEELSSYAEMECKNFPIRELPVAKTIPISADVVWGGAYASAKFQLSFMDGGALLSVCFAHAVADGNGMDQLVALLAEECRLADFNIAAAADNTYHEPVVSEALRDARIGKFRGMDRSTISHAKLNPAMASIENHPGYVLLPDPELSSGATHGDSVAETTADHNSTPPGPPDTDCYMLQLSAASVKALKSAASPSNLPPGNGNKTSPTSDSSTTVPTTSPSYITTHDAIESLLWRFLAISRHTTSVLADPSTEMTFTITNNARKYLQPPVSRTQYIGNCVYFAHATLPVSTFLQPWQHSIPLTASAIRTAINSITPDRYAGLLSLAYDKSVVPHVSMLFWNVFQASTTCVASGSAYGSHWAMYSPQWGAAFGDGLVRRMRSPDTGFFANFKDMMHMLPRVNVWSENGKEVVAEREEDGPAEVQVWFSREGFEAVRRDEAWEEFGLRVIDGPEGVEW